MIRGFLICVAIMIWAAVSLPQSASGDSAMATDRETDIPNIDKLGTKWLDVDEMAHMPSLHNFHDMAACAPDLVGISYNPDGQLFDWPTGPRWFRYISLPLVHMTINGRELETAEFRWFPHQAVRKRQVDGINVETTVRMVFEGAGLLYEVAITNTSDRNEEVKVALSFPGKKVETPQGLVVAYQSNDPKLGKSHGFGDTVPKKTGHDSTKLEMVHAFADPPQTLADSDDHAVATWIRELKPKEVWTIRFAMSHARNRGEFPSAELIAAVADRAKSFDQQWDGIKLQWAERWKDMFTPGNAHFSGHLPTLVTKDAQLSDIYYRSLLTLLVLHRTNMKMCDRVFVTSGERDKGVVFFWDTSMWSKVFALLEPNAMKEHCRIFLSCDPHRGPVYNMALGQQWDGWYAANDSTIFTFVSEYVNTTGDVAFLDEQVGDRTVLGHLDSLATNWQQLQTDKSVMLADYGENRNLLECAPAYIHRVPSFNAANVWMMRAVAELYAQRGNTARAAELREWADQFSRAVLDLYKPGDGVWYALHRDGQRVELRHCYDFVCIGRFMNSDLSPAMRREMVEFVERELVDEPWMRAMSPLDIAAADSDRPDHGPMGAYDAWPALTAESMCLLGAWRPALDFLRSTQAALEEGVYGQAREYYGPNRSETIAPVHIAMRGACMRESVGGGAFAEMIIGTLFGYQPRATAELELYRAHDNRGFEGELRNLQHQGKLLDITSGSNGVSFRYHE